MPDIRPYALPVAPNVPPDAAIMIDTGSTVQRATALQIADTAAPIASQAQAEAGSDNVTRTTPLRVRQAIEAQAATLSALSAPTGAGMTGFTFAEGYGDGTAGKALLGVRSIMAAPYNADADNVANDSAAIQAALADGVAVLPDRTVKMDTAITGNFRAIMLGTALTGAHPLDEQYPTFGACVLKLIGRGNTNCFVGIAHNDSPSGTLTFPTGVTGYGRMDSNGNVVFGLYGVAETHATAGCPTNEIITFNHGGPPSGALPPDRSFGTLQQVPVVLTIDPDGTYNSAIGIHICRGGVHATQTLTGIYIDRESCVNFGLFVDSSATSTYVPAVLHHSVNRQALALRGRGTPIAAGAVIDYEDGGGVIRWSLKQDGSQYITSAITRTTVGVAGAAAAIPALPAGYIQINIDGFTKHIPYYHAP